VRVLLVGTGVYPIPPTGYGGVERTISELSRALAQAGAEVTVLNRVRRQRSTDEYRFALELPKLLRRERFDVLHAGSLGSIDRTSTRPTRDIGSSDGG
jgi:hypothetical protein